MLHTSLGSWGCSTLPLLYWQNTFKFNEIELYVPIHKSCVYSVHPLTDYTAFTGDHCDLVKFHSMKENTENLLGLLFWCSFYQGTKVLMKFRQVKCRSHSLQFCGQLQWITTILIQQISPQMMVKNFTWVGWIFFFGGGERIGRDPNDQQMRFRHKAVVNKIELSQCRARHNELWHTMILKVELLVMYNNAVWIGTTGIDVQQMHNE